MKFLVGEEAKPAFLNIGNQPQQQQPQSPAPPPFQRLQFGANAVGKSATAAPQQPQQQYDKVDVPAQQESTPSGPQVGVQRNAGAQAQQIAQNSTKKKAPLVANPDHDANVVPDGPAEPAPGPQVSGDRGRLTTDRDPTTGIVYDQDANNKPVAAIAKTFVGDDGTVHYTKQNPDGSPKAPWEDKDGWKQLSKEQQTAVAQDYLSSMKSWNESNGKNADGTNNAFDPEQWAQLDDAGKMAAAEQFVSGNTQAQPVQQKIRVDERGAVHYVEKDEKGNLIPPWSDAEGWGSLSEEQQKQLKDSYANALRQQASKQQAQGSGVAGTGIDQETWDGMSPEQQADALQGIKQPTPNPDGTFTFPDQEGGEGATVTKDAQGSVKSRTKADGTQIVYGTGSASTTTTPDGMVTTVDNQGNKKVSTKEGTPARAAEDERKAVGFNLDGSQKSTLEFWADSHDPPLDPQQLTPKQMDEFRSYMATNSAEKWTTGLVYARAAVQAGLLSQDDYLKMLGSDFSHSFGAWIAANRDIIAAIDKSNIKLDPPKGEPTMFQMNGSQNYQDADQYFADMRGGRGYTPPDALTSTDYKLPLWKPSS